MIWGSYVVLSALAIVLISVTAYRQGHRWAWYALLYQFLFLAIVASVEPDYVVPSLFAVVLAATLWRSPIRPKGGVDADGSVVASR